MNKLTTKQQKIVLRYMELAELRAKYHYSEYIEYTGNNLFLDYDDFLSFAYEGLCNAVSTYDSSKCSKIETHIINTIRYKIKSFAIHENSTLKLPHNSSDSEVRKEVRNIGINNSLSTHLEDTSVPNNYRSCVYFFIPKDIDAMFDKIEMDMFLNSVYKHLSKNENELFEELFIKKNSQTDVAKKMNVHINTITRRKKKLLDKIKSFL